MAGIPGEPNTFYLGQATANGLPDGVFGRIGVAAAPSDPSVVYTIMESEADGELWSSDDRGRNWRLVNNDPDINDRPFYYADLRVDPATSERVYVLSSRLCLSTDGGRTFEQLGDDIHMEEAVAAR